jgi:hypothetical protein
MFQSRYSGITKINAPHASTVDALYVALNISGADA